MRPDDVKAALDVLASEVTAPQRGRRDVVVRGRRRRMQKRVALVGIAAALIAAIATVGTIAHTNGDKHVVSSVPSTSSPNVGASGVAPAVMSSMFPSALEAWKCGNPMQYTSDGGKSWRRVVLPAAVPAIGGPCTAVPGVNAWATWPSVNGSDWHILRIRGLDNMRVFALPKTAANSTFDPPTFIDRDHGWFKARNERGATTLYRTADGSATWTRASTNQPLGPLAFTNAELGWSVYGTEIVATTDGGMSWNKVVVPTPRGTVARFGLTARGTSIVAWSGTLISGLRYRTFFDVSSDNGRSWEVRQGPTGFELPGKGIENYFSATDGTHWQLVSVSALRVTNDGGKTWQARPDLPFPKDRNRQYPISFPTANVGWIVTEQGKMLRTTDGGRTWADVTNGVTEPSPTPAAVLISPSQLAFPSATEGWVCGDPFLYSDEFHAALEEVGIPAHASPPNLGKESTQQSLCGAAPGGNAWLLRGTADPQRPQLLRIRSDGTSIAESPSIEIPPATVVDSISFVDADHGWALVAYQSFMRRDLYGTNDGGASWTLLKAAAPIVGDVTFTDTNRGWASASVSGKLATTDDGGRIWRLETVPILHSPAFAAGIALAYARGNTIVVSGELPTGNFAEPFYDVSTDGGKTWSMRTGPKDTEVPGTLSHPFSAADAEHWALGFGNVLYVTDNGGRTWQRRAPVTGIDEMWYIARISTRVAFVSGVGDPRTLPNVVLRSTDGLRTWAQIAVTAQPDTSPDVATPGVIVTCPSHPLTPSSASDVRSAVANAAIDYLEATRSWSGGTVTAVRRVGDTGAGGRWNRLTAKVRACGRAVADSAWLVELRRDISQVGVAGPLSAVVLAHHVDGWHVFGRTG